MHFKVFKLSKLKWKKNVPQLKLSARHLTIEVFVTYSLSSKILSIIPTTILASFYLNFHRYKH